MELKYRVNQVSKNACNMRFWTVLFIQKTCLGSIRTAYNENTGKDLHVLRAVKDK